MRSISASCCIWTKLHRELERIVCHSCLLGGCSSWCWKPIACRSCVGFPPQYITCKCNDGEPSSLTCQRSPTSISFPRFCCTSVALPSQPFFCIPHIGNKLFLQSTLLCWYTHLGPRPSCESTSFIRYSCCHRSTLSSIHHDCKPSIDSPSACDIWTISTNCSANTCSRNGTLRTPRCCTASVFSSKFSSCCCWTTSSTGCI